MVFVLIVRGNPQIYRIEGFFTDHSELLGLVFDMLAGTFD